MKHPSILTAIGIQAVAGWFLLFAPFGFDRRSEWGLDFGHLLLFLAAYVVAMLYGITVAIWRQVKWALVVQLVGLAMLLVPVIAGMMEMPFTFTGDDFRTI